MERRLCKLWLCSIPGMNARRATALHDYFGSFEGVYRAERSAFPEQHADVFYHPAMEHKSLEGVRQTLERCEQLGIDVVAYDEPQYPARLLQINDAPTVLYVKGTLPDLSKLFTVAMVGARRSSLYGNRVAAQLSTDLAQAGAIVVSGMARGIDTAAHRGALRGDGKTIAVLGCGVDRIYPPENGELKKLIESHGAVISEYPPGTSPLPAHFPRRNRIISGLASAVVIVEGRATSGSMITAQLAQDQGREVYCVPGNIDEPLSVGPNQLIRDGATLITCAGDLIADYTRNYPQLLMEVLESANARAEEQGRKQLPPDQQKVLSVLQKNHPTHMDEICFRAGIEVAVASQCLLLLEMEGFVAQLPGKQYVLTEKR